MSNNKGGKAGYRKIMKRDMLRIEITHCTRGRKAIFGPLFGDQRVSPMGGGAEKKGWEHGYRNEEWR